MAVIRSLVSQLPALRQQIADGVEAVGQDLEAELKDMLSGPSPAPVGSPPGLASGELRASIRHAVDSTPGTIRLRVWAGAEHARYLDSLEGGGDESAPHPFVSTQYYRLRHTFVPRLSARLSQ